MRKVLVFVLLGFTSIAMAGPVNTGKLIQLSVDGQPAPDVIELYESDWITLDILVANGHYTAGIDLDLEIIGPGHIMLDPAYVSVPEDIIVGDFESWSKLVEGVTDTGIAAIVGVSFGEVEGTIVDHILFHCDGLGEVTVQLTLHGDTEVDGNLITPEDLGGITIIQIPEPMTLSLLGLGGLFLVRRKRK